MNVVLVCVGNFQPCILENVGQLRDLGHSRIHILTNRHLLSRFAAVEAQVWAVEDTPDEYGHYERSRLDKSFRGGFWTLTSTRFFHIHAWMKARGIKQVLHLENDVLIYRHADTLLECVEPGALYVPFDRFHRSIASVLVIPDADVLGRVLDQYDYGKNDMENFSQIRARLPGLIRPLPIFVGPNPAETAEHQFLTENFPRFGCIFDAAAIGQYLGGCDPANGPGNGPGFVNETCLIQYDKYRFNWEDGRPRIQMEWGEWIPIFNLHIHCKDLARFRSLPSAGA